VSRTVVCLALAVLGSAMTAGTAVGQSPALPPLEGAPKAPILTTNHTLFTSLNRIAARSTLWRQAVEAVGRRGRRALVLTPEQVVVADALDGAPTDAFDPTVLAEVAPVAHADSRVSVVLVVVNLPLIEEAHRRNRSLPGEFHADLDRILVHEIYGHALPYLLVGDLSGRCPDPTPGQLASDACSIRRENAVRAELRLGRRTGYGLESLALTRSGWR
jgi:hypothetical protein